LTLGSQVSMAENQSSGVGWCCRGEDADEQVWEPTGREEIRVNQKLVAGCGERPRWKGLPVAGERESILGPIKINRKARNSACRGEEEKGSSKNRGPLSILLVRCGVLSSRRMDSGLLMRFATGRTATQMRGDAGFGTASGVRWRAWVHRTLRNRRDRDDTVGVVAIVGLVGDEDDVLP